MRRIALVLFLTVMVMPGMVGAATPTPDGRCEWCGRSCEYFSPSQKCTNTTPTPSDTLCKRFVNDAHCFTTKPSSTPYPDQCAKCADGSVRIKGDADCNGKVTKDDFDMWVIEYLGLSSTRKSDFDCNGKVDLVDFSIWKGIHGVITVAPTVIPTNILPTNVPTVAVMATATLKPTRALCSTEGKQCRGTADCCSGLVCSEENGGVGGEGVCQIPPTPVVECDPNNVPGCPWGGAEPCCINGQWNCCQN